ncbi:hypothetical protein MTO96_022896 [Rhipicephalus appendiculatus]
MRCSPWTVANPLRVAFAAAALGLLRGRTWPLVPAVRGDLSASATLRSGRLKSACRHCDHCEASRKETDVSPSTRLSCLEPSGTLCCW